VAEIPARGRDVTRLQRPANIPQMTWIGMTRNLVAWLPARPSCEARAQMAP
jgi:hypothetical protein